MVSYQDVPVKQNAGIVHPGHPPVIDTGLLADKTQKLKAGTILKADTSGKLAAAAEADDPVAVLTEDSDGVNAEVLVLWHGTVIQGRLIDSSGTDPVPASEVMVFNLRAAGMYPAKVRTDQRGEDLFVKSKPFPLINRKGIAIAKFSA